MQPSLFTLVQNTHDGAKRAEHFFLSFQNVAFVFVSDDLKWARDNIGDPKSDCFYIGNENVTGLKREDALRAGFDIGKPILLVGNVMILPYRLSILTGADMALLSQTNHSILSYGTYGMWGALLSGGKAILPKSFSETKESVEILNADLPGWTFIEDK